MTILGKKIVGIIGGETFERNERLEMKTKAYKGFRNIKIAKEKQYRKIKKAVKFSC